MATESQDDGGAVGVSGRDERGSAVEDEAVDAESVDVADGAINGGEADDDAADGRNAVAVHFENGDVTTYAFVVRTADAEWLYAERLAGDDDGFDEEEIEAVNADAVCRIAAPRVHLFGDGVVHLGDDLLVDPTTLLEDSWFDADATLL